MLCELFLRGVAYTSQAGTNSAACFGDFFIRGASDVLLEINQARHGEDRMGVGVNKSGKYHIVRAIDFVSLPRQLVLRDVVCRADRDDLSISDENGTVFEDDQFAHLRPAAR